MSNKLEATFHGPPLITDHVFRTVGAKTGGIRKGMCVWHGTCNQPETAHESSRRKSHVKPTPEKERGPLE